MHDHIHDHDGLGEHEHKPEWVIYLKQQDDTGYWTCAKVEGDSEMEAIQNMLNTMPVRSPFKAWAFPILEEEGHYLTATINIVQEVR